MNIYVYIDAYNLVEQPILMGILMANNVRGKQVFSFTADTEWLKSNSFKYLDPDIGQYSGTQYTSEKKINFGLFLDSCPDRWGRVLMERREIIKALDSGNPIKKLQESDYLLGIYDGNRMGALRFKTALDGNFLDNDSLFATPPIATLRELEQASLNYENANTKQSQDYHKWINMLYQPGSSLGGARPKANVLDTDNNLWIAKFPSKHDTIDVGAWEYLVTEMAREFDLVVPETKIEKFSSTYHTFLTKRFDRNGVNKRIYFASAMTLLGYNDGDNAKIGVSYLELADFLQNYGTTDLAKDLKELWKRIVFNIAISNCDDHLRNHGFILSPKGWTLSPVYDLTPNANGLGLTLNITEEDNRLDYNLALATCDFYGIEQAEAKMLIDRVKSICSSWQQRANNIGISRLEQKMMQSAFNI